MIFALKHLWDSKVTSETRWAEYLGDLEKHRVWETVPPENPYGSLDALLKAEIGVDAGESKQIVKLRVHGGERRGDKFQDRPLRARSSGNSRTLETWRV